MYLKFLFIRLHLYWPWCHVDLWTWMPCRWTTPACTAGTKAGSANRNKLTSQLSANNHSPNYCKIAFSFTGHVYDHDRHPYFSAYRGRNDPKWTVETGCGSDLLQTMKGRMLQAGREFAAWGILSYLLLLSRTVWEVWGAKFFKMEKPLFFSLASWVTWEPKHWTQLTLLITPPPSPVFCCPGCAGQPGALLTVDERTLDAAESAESMPGELQRS